MSDKSKIMDYDPNLVLCGRTAKQIVRLTFAQWEYRGVFDVVVMGNATGLDVISCAVGNLYDSLESIKFFNHDKKCDDEMPVINLGNLECQDQDFEGEDWLSGMLIGAEIISIEPEV